MRMHLLTHEAGLYRCPKCDKTFAQRRDFDDHIKAHISEAKKKADRKKKKEEIAKRLEQSRREGLRVKMLHSAFETKRRSH